MAYYTKRSCQRTAGNKNYSWMQNLIYIRYKWHKSVQKYKYTNTQKIYIVGRIARAL